MMTLLSANTDIMVRTLLLVFAFSYFTNEAAKFGTVALAATHIVLQLMAFTPFSWMALPMWQSLRQVEVTAHAIAPSSTW